jgi:hypothetical protein
MTSCHSGESRNPVFSMVTANLDPGFHRGDNLLQFHQQHDPLDVAVRAVALFLFTPESVSVREWCRCKAATMLIIHMVYQRVANAADAPLSDAPQGGGVNQGNTGVA